MLRNNFSDCSHGVFSRRFQNMPREFFFHNKRHSVTCRAIPYVTIIITSERRYALVRATCITRISRTYIIINVSSNRCFFYFYFFFYEVNMGSKVYCTCTVRIISSIWFDGIQETLYFHIIKFFTESNDFASSTHVYSMRDKNVNKFENWILVQVDIFWDLKIYIRFACLMNKYKINI